MLTSEPSPSVCRRYKWSSVFESMTSPDTFSNLINADHSCALLFNCSLTHCLTLGHRLILHNIKSTSEPLVLKAANSILLTFSLQALCCFYNLMFFRPRWSPRKAFLCGCLWAHCVDLSDCLILFLAAFSSSALHVSPCSSSIHKLGSHNGTQVLL